MPVEIGKSQLLAERAPPAAGPRPTPAPDAYLVDPNLQDRPWSSAADRDRPDERMSDRAALAVELGDARLKLPSLADLGRWRAATPTRVERGKGDCISGVDRQNWLELAREVAVNGPLVEWDLVDRYRPRVRGA
jgi:hypothetical protein